jgi:hypothetical protein
LNRWISIDEAATHLILVYERRYFFQERYGYLSGL